MTKQQDDYLEGKRYVDGKRQDGTLSDGQTHRTPMMLRDEQPITDAIAAFDAYQKTVLGDGYSVATHRPGYAESKWRDFVRNQHNDAIERAYSEAAVIEANAWHTRDEFTRDDIQYDEAVAKIEKLTDAKERSYNLASLADENAWWRDKQR